MSIFTHKKLTSTTRVCLRLKALREAAELSVEEMCEKTKLNKTYIRALESCAFQELPKGRVYQKNFIKRYLNALGIDPSNYIRQFLLEEEDTLTARRHAHPHKPFSSFHFHSLPLYMRRGAMSIVMIAVIWYLGGQIQQTVTAPRLLVYTPENGHITHDHAITVRGVSEKETAITVNGKEVMNNGEGLFQETVGLIPGVNTIIITATKKHGKETSETRYVTYRPKESLSFSEETVDKNSGT